MLMLFLCALGPQGLFVHLQIVVFFKFIFIIMSILYIIP